MPTETKPRYIQLSDDLRARIQNGEWEIGDRLPSFTEMYHEHGAATATIQKAYGVLEKEGFVERRHRSGIYVTNPPVIQNDTIAYIIPADNDAVFYASTSYSMRLLRGAHRSAATLGYQMTLCTLDQLRGNHFPVSGYIVQGNAYHIKYCASLGRPVVSLISQIPGVSAVGTDDVAGFESITQHLIDQGHQRISIIISDDDDSSRYPKRLEGYDNAFVKNGIQPNQHWQCRLKHYDGEADYTKAGYSEMQRWLRNGWVGLGCTAIVTQNDGTAIGVIKALRQHGYRVPQDVSVTGYDNSGEDSHFDLKLTTVHVPLEDIAQKAIQCLDELVTANLSNIQTLSLPTHVVVGETTIKYEGGRAMKS